MTNYFQKHRRCIHIKYSKVICPRNSYGNIADKDCLLYILGYMSGWGVGY
jgi:hypothetical protein